MLFHQNVPSYLCFNIKQAIFSRLLPDTILLPSIYFNSLYNKYCLPFNFVNFKELDYTGKFFFKGSPQHFDQFPGFSVNTFQSDRNEMSCPLIILRNSNAIKFNRSY